MLHGGQFSVARTDELAVSDALALHVVVAIGGPRANDVRTAVLEARRELIHGVAEVVAVAALVAQSEDRDLLTAEAGQIAVDESASQTRARSAVAGRPVSVVRRTHPTQCRCARCLRRCARSARRR